MAKCVDCGNEGAEHETLDGAPVHSVSGCARLLKADRDEARAEVERLRAVLRQADSDSRERYAQRLEEEADQLRRDIEGEGYESRFDAGRVMGLREGAWSIRERGEGGDQ